VHNHLASNNLKDFAIEPPVTERRQVVRYGCSLQTAYHLSALVEPYRRAGIRNISVRGLSLVLSCRLETGTLVTVDIYNKSSRYTCQIQLRIVYVIPHPDGDFIVGGEFARHLSDEEIDALLFRPGETPSSDVTEALNCSS
jgi:hypothetical protein